MTELTRPTPFRRGERPAIPGGDMPFVVEEVRRIEATLRDLVDLCPQEANAAPPRLRSGMQRFAVSPWWPVAGQAADAWVYYDGASASWLYL